MPKTKQFSEQVALVTGGGTGIGRAFAEALATAGARVVIASRRDEILRRTAEELNQKCDAERVFAFALDIRNRAQIDSLVTDVIDRWRSLDVIINNSGLAVPETVDQITEDGWDKVMETNLRGVMQLVRAALPYMTKNDLVTSLTFHHRPANMATRTYRRIALQSSVCSATDRKSVV